MSDFMRQLLAQPEGKTLEFKRDLSSPLPVLKTLTAFANSAGGRLVLGVTDERQVWGVEDPLEEEERLCSLVADSIAPRLVPNVELVTVDGKTLVMLEVFPSGMRPHWLKAEGMQNGVQVRLGSTNRQAGPQLIAELQRGAAGVSFDSLPMPQLSLDDIDIAALREDFPNRTLDESTLQSLKLLVRDQGRLVPTQAAILLYGKDRRFHFDDAWIQCGRFIGRDKADIFDHTELHDPLPRAVDSILLFLKKHAMRGADFSEIRRKDIWSIPIRILREVVINALVHADYSHRGTPFRVAFFDDRIEVENPGLLLPGLTVEDLKRGVSQIRNPVIARVFRELDLIEQWGSGVPGIFREAREQHLPEPEILEIAGRVRFIVHLPEALALSGKAGNSVVEEATIARQVTGHVAGQVTRQVTRQVTGRVKQLLQVCDGEKSRKELMRAQGLSSRENFEKLYLRPALEQQLLERTIPDKPSSRLQKYRITAKGRNLLVSQARETPP